MMWKHNIYYIIDIEDRATEIVNIHRKSREVWIYGFRDIYVDKHIYRHNDHKNPGGKVTIYCYLLFFYHTYL